MKKMSSIKRKERKSSISYFSSYPNLIAQPHLPISQQN
jgi:hypothetical protein